jgi:hypothetical protein
VGRSSRGITDTTMTKKEMLQTQATEHKELADLIVSNVAERLWKKDELTKQLDRLYMMGTRHGWESANEYIKEHFTG